MPNILKVLVALVSSMATYPALAQGKTIELTTLIETFMTVAGEIPQWSMGATGSTPAIQWKTSGVDECQKQNCGTHMAWRHGEARVTLNGTEMQHLRTRLEPITWELVMASTAPRRFGPELVEVSPKCDTVACYFNFLQSVPGFTTNKLCHAGPGPFRQTGYLLRKARREIYISFNEHEGSGGASSSLTLHLKAPATPDALCAEAKAMESAPRSNNSFKPIPLRGAA